MITVLSHEGPWRDPRRSEKWIRPKKIFFQKWSKLARKLVNLLFWHHDPRSQLEPSFPKSISSHDDYMHVMPVDSASTITPLNLTNAAQNNSYGVEHQYRGSGKVFNFWRTIVPRMVESLAVLGVIPKAKYKLACITVYLSPHPTLRLRTLREAPFWNLLGLYGHCQNSCRPPPPQRRAGGYSLFLTMGCFLRWDV